MRRIGSIIKHDPIERILSAIGGAAQPPRVAPARGLQLF
jgi:hypothetical protein